jgi:hypothetical protein
MVQSGQQLQGGFFDIFFQGFTKGIMRSREFRLIMREIQQVMRIVFYEGIRIGRDFVKYFPGVAEIFGGLADIFQPARWRAMMNSVREVLQSFFKNVNKWWWIYKNSKGGRQFYKSFNLWNVRHLKSKHCRSPKGIC